MLPEIKQLLELQSIDERLDNLTSQIARLRAQRRSVEQRLVDERESLEEVREYLKQLEHDSRMKNLEVDELDVRIRAYQKRLDEGIISFKEMEDLRAKIQSERSRINRMEDEALALMDSIEAKRSELAEAEARHAAREDDLHAQVTRIDTEIERASVESTAGREKRTQCADDVSAYLLTHYDSLHTRFSRPITPIEHGTCTGCKLKVSANTTERTRGGMGVITCEHCSRILYTP